MNVCLACTVIALVAVSVTYINARSYRFTMGERLVDNGQGIISSEELSVISCVYSCLMQPDCLTIVHYKPTSMCSFLHSTEHMSYTPDSGYSHTYVGDYCDNGWLSFGESCYFFGDQVYEWSDAIDYCYTLDASLVEIETESENEYIKEVLRTISNENHWIGMSDSNVEGVWVWSSGAPVGYTDWGHEQPNNGDWANCGAIWKLYGHKWVDEPCGAGFYPICEKDKRLIFP